MHPIVQISLDIIEIAEALETAETAKQEPTQIVVMSQAHEETIRSVVKAGKDLGV